MRVFLSLLILMMACPDLWAKSQSGTREFDLRVFTVELPANWKYVEQMGTDSFVGEFHGDGVVLAFDYSEEGYSWRLPEPLDQYLNGRKGRRASWIDICAFCESDAIYTSNVEVTKAEKLKELGPVEFAKLKILPFPKDEFSVEILSDFDKSKYPDADYLGVLTRPDGARKEIGIKVPDEIKYTNTVWRETDRFYIGTSVATSGKKGTTGVFFKDKGSDFTFVLSTDSPLTEELKARLLESFNSIKFKAHPIGE